jgi:hypothetical protein
MTGTRRTTPDVRTRAAYNDAVEEALCFACIVAARHRPEVFGQRLRFFVRMTAQNKRFGMVR